MDKIDQLSRPGVNFLDKKSGKVWNSIKLGIFSGTLPNDGLNTIL
jgi:hypothetical protein